MFPIDALFEVLRPTTFSIYYIFSDNPVYSVGSDFSQSIQSIQSV